MLSPSIAAPIFLNTPPMLPGSRLQAAIIPGISIVVSTFLNKVADAPGKAPEPEAQAHGHT